jgi:hypothetical protein
MNIADVQAAPAGVPISLTPIGGAREADEPEGSHPLARGYFETVGSARERVNSISSLGPILRP